MPLKLLKLRAHQNYARSITCWSVFKYDVTASGACLFSYNSTFKDMESKIYDILPRIHILIKID